MGGRPISTVARWTVLLVLGAGLGCASAQPVLGPNEQLRRVGRAAAQKDIDECLALARDYGVKKRGSGEESVARDAVEDAASTAAGGAVAGAILGEVSPGRAGAAAGAFAGTRTLLRGLFRSNRPSDAYRSFVDSCLAQRGYQPVGWQ
jgi:outer membrane lipoprotein SlyB